MRKANVHTILGHVNLIDGVENAIIIFPNGTIMHIEDALLSSRLKRNLLSFKDVSHNGYHLETINENNNECLYITSYNMGNKTINEKLKTTISRLYCVQIRVMESYASMS